ncbi:MAG: hypothetical protein ACTSP4_16725 [Candidatus Hodarchaeales archaeon]
MDSNKNYCWFCGELLQFDDIYCGSCGQMVSGERAIKGSVEFKGTPELWVGIAVGVFILINIVNIVLALFFPTTLGFVVLLAPTAIVIAVILIIIAKSQSKEGLQVNKWIGRKLNPYKPMSTSDRIGTLIGTFFLVFPLIIMIFIYTDENIPLLTRRDILVAIILFLPLAIEATMSMAKFAGGNAPEMRPVLAIKNIISILLLGYLVSNWFFDVPGTITWLEGEVIGSDFLTSWLPSLDLVVVIIQAIIRFVIVIQVIEIFWHLFIFTIWLDIKHNVLGGSMASVVSEVKTGKMKS